MEKSKVARNERRKKPHAWDFFIHKIKGYYACTLVAPIEHK